MNLDLDLEMKVKMKNNLDFDKSLTNIIKTLTNNKNTVILKFKDMPNTIYIRMFFNSF